MKFFETLDWPKISAIIRGAKSRVVYVAAGLDDAVAAALADASSRLGPADVSVILDSDAESFRLGYGIFDAVAMLRDRGIPVRRQRRLRIGLLACDHDGWSFSMPPLLVEKIDDEQVNAIRLSREQIDSAIAAIGLDSDSPRNDGKDEGSGATGPEIGLEAMDDQSEEDIRRALEADPPQRFDIARKIRVFNSKIEFVELELKGSQIQRRRVALPSDLVVAVEDMTARDRISAEYKVIENAATIGGERIAKLIAELRETYLKSIPEYGRVILRAKRDAFTNDLERLRMSLDEFRSGILERLSKEINSSIESLVLAFLPGVMAKPPRQLSAQVSQLNLDKARRWLEDRLRRIFPTAEDLVGDISMKCVFKGVTYEVLSDPNFQKVIKNLFPLEDWSTPLTEFDAAPSEPEDPFGNRRPAH